MLKCAFASSRWRVGESQMFFQSRTLGHPGRSVFQGNQEERFKIFHLSQSRKDRGSFPTLSEQIVR